jgi:hypothetical protein
VRDVISDGRILEQAVKDIRKLLLGDMVSKDEIETDVLHLWDDKNGFVSHAVSYGKEFDESDVETFADGYGTILEDEV